jgi:hypothetical protein
MKHSPRLRYFLAAAVAVIAGASLRLFGYGSGLPYVLVKYGGSVIWGAMVFFVVAFVLGRRDVRLVALAAIVAAVASEFFRLYHTPDLDAFRLTLAGQLLLGRIFSLWNILAYAIGIGLAAVMEIWLSRLTVIKAGSQ